LKPEKLEKIEQTKIEIALEKKSQEIKAPLMMQTKKQE